MQDKYQQHIDFCAQLNVSMWLAQRAVEPNSNGSREKQNIAILNTVKSNLLSMPLRELYHDKTHNHATVNADIRRRTQELESQALYDHEPPHGDYHLAALSKYLLEDLDPSYQRAAIGVSTQEGYSPLEIATALCVYAKLRDDKDFIAFQESVSSPNNTQTSEQKMAGLGQLMAQKEVFRPFYGLVEPEEITRCGEVVQHIIYDAATLGVREVEQRNSTIIDAHVDDYVAALAKNTPSAELPERAGLTSLQTLGRLTPVNAKGHAGGK